MPSPSPLTGAGFFLSLELIKSSIFLRIKLRQQHRDIITQTGGVVQR